MEFICMPSWSRFRCGQAALLAYQTYLNLIKSGVMHRITFVMDISLFFFGAQYARWNDLRYAMKINKLLARLEIPVSIFNACLWCCRIFGSMRSFLMKILMILYVKTNLISLDWNLVKKTDCFFAQNSHKKIKNVINVKMKYNENFLLLKKVNKDLELQVSSKINNKTSFVS